MTVQYLIINDTGSSPSKSMMTLPSAMGTEVAVRSNPRLAGPAAGRAWEETGIAGGINRRLNFFFRASYICERGLSSYVSMACLVRDRHPVIS